MSPGGGDRSEQSVHNQSAGCRQPTDVVVTEHPWIEPLTETFARFAEDAEFCHWNEGRPSECRFVYVFQDGGVWKFTLKDWWRFVTSTVRNNGKYSLPFTKRLRFRQKKVTDLENGVSHDKAIRGVSLNRWTLTNWTDELSGEFGRDS
jgi:hypothetical protein